MASVIDSGVGPPLAPLILTPKSPVGAAGVMAGREDHPAHGAVLADQVGGGRSGEDAAGGGNQPGHAMGGGHAGDHADGCAVAVATVTSHHQGAAGYAWQHLQARLDEAL